MSWAQINALGVDRRTATEWVAQGYLHPRLPRVYAVGHPGRSVESDLAEALLYAGPGAALSHITAASWLGLLDGPSQPSHVSTPRRCGDQPGVVVHRERTFDRTWHRGFPTTPLPLLLLDLAATQPLRVVRHALAGADYRGMLDVPAVTAVLKRGRGGSAKLRVALAEHQPKLANTRSALEVALVEICERAGLPVPEINARVAGWLVDAAWWPERIVIEVDGYDNHRSPAQLKRDRRKELEVRAAGFTIVRYSSEQIFEQPAAVTADLRRQRAQAA